MTRLLTAVQKRQIESAAMASGRVDGLELMERAGRGAVEAILDWRPELALGPHRAAVLCGPGNNGGDGYVIARLLHQRGWDVEVIQFGKLAKQPAEAAHNMREWAKLGAIVPAAKMPLPTAGFDIWIDAIFGIGQKHDLDGRVAVAFELIDEDADAFAGRGVAIDVPTGLCPDSGRLRGIVPEFALTVTFHSANQGHYLASGPETCGTLRVVDIGLAEWDDAAGETTMLAGPDRRLQKTATSAHKYDHGHALVLAGDAENGGAARLAARGSLRVGAGLVTLCCPTGSLLFNAAHLSAIMLRPVDDAGELAVALADRRIRSLCLGPGLGTGEATGELVRVALASRKAVVLDADALSVFQSRPEDLFAQMHPNAVLTPHIGEFERIFPDIAARLLEQAGKGPVYSRIDAARDAASRAGCVILLKGPDTIIADPAGKVIVSAACYDRAAPWLATAGSGDVLAGFINGLMARGFAAIEAAATAAWLHVECAREFGPGLISEDLPEMLPAVLRRLDG
jgi:hydroxyethylthiazole kinase-like uncharacterized protein yjeF